MKKYKCILFDLDGTILDTKDLVWASYRHTFKHLFDEDISDDRILSYFGVPLKEAFEQEHPEQVEEMLRTFRTHNKLHHDLTVKIFPGVAETLDRLFHKGIYCGVVSSKKNDMVERGLKVFGLDQYMTCVVGSDDTDKHKPEADPILKALEQIPVPYEAVLMVGDSPFDILSAQNAGVDSAAVAWGARSLEHLLKYHPDHVIHHMDELLQWV